jgi:hypothetical protein
MSCSRKASGLQARLSEASNAARTANTQLNQMKSALSDSTSVPAALRASYDSLLRGAGALKKRFFIRDEGDESFDWSEFRQIITFKLGNAVGAIGGATEPASETDLAQWNELKLEVPQVIEQVNGFVAKLKPFYQRLAEAGIYPAVPADREALAGHSPISR